MAGGEGALRLGGVSDELIDLRLLEPLAADFPFILSELFFSTSSFSSCSRLIFTLGSRLEAPEDDSEPSVEEESLEAFLDFFFCVLLLSLVFLRFILPVFSFSSSSLEELPLLLLLVERECRSFLLLRRASSSFCNICSTFFRALIFFRTLSSSSLLELSRFLGSCWASLLGLSGEPDFSFFISTSSLSSLRLL